MCLDVGFQMRAGPNSIVSTQLLLSILVLPNIGPGTVSNHVASTKAFNGIRKLKNSRMLQTLLPHSELPSKDFGVEGKAGGARVNYLRGAAIEECARTTYTSAQRGRPAHKYANLTTARIFKRYFGEDFIPIWPPKKARQWRAYACERIAALLLVSQGVGHLEKQSLSLNGD